MASTILVSGFLCFCASPPLSPILSSLSFPFPSPLLLSFPSPLPSQFPSCVRPMISVPAPSLFRSYAPSFAPAPIPVPVPAPKPVPVSVPAPDSDPAPDLVRSFPSLGHGYPFGAMRVYRNQALRTELSGPRKRYPLSSEMMTRAE